MDKEKEISDEDQYDTAFDEQTIPVNEVVPKDVQEDNTKDEQHEDTLVPTAEQKLADIIKQREDDLVQFNDKIRELENRLKTQDPTPVKESIPEEIESYFDLYEGSRPAIEYLIGKVTEKIIKESEVNMAGQLQFDLNVMSGCLDEKGAWMDGHPDVYKVVNSQEWKDKVKQDPKLMDTNDPREAIRIINKFKEEQILNKLKTTDSRKHQDTITKIKAIEGTVSSGASLGRNAGKMGESKSVTIQEQYDEFDSAFDEK